MFQVTRLNVIFACVLSALLAMAAPIIVHKIAQNLENTINASQTRYKINITEFASDSTVMTFTTYMQTLNRPEAEKEFKRQCFTVCDEVECPDSIIFTLVAETPTTLNVLMDSTIRK